MKRITKLDLKYKVLDGLLLDKYVGKVMTEEDIVLFKQRVRLMNCLITLVDPVSKQSDEFFDFAVLFFGLNHDNPYTFDEEVMDKLVDNYVQDNFDVYDLVENGLEKKILYNGDDVYRLD